MPARRSVRRGEASAHGAAGKPAGKGKGAAAAKGAAAKKGPAAPARSAAGAPVRTMGLGSLKPAKGSRRPAKRRGLGPASGLGGTAGRGHKGQHARSGGKVSRWFEGGQMPIQRRLPKVGFTNIHRVPHQVVNVANLARFGAGESVTRETLKAKRLIDRGDLPVKILGMGELSLALHVSVDAVSGSAKTKIEAAGGTVTLPVPKVRRPRGVKKGAS
ncbi:MAG TPA: 50S ribosomal protein L15 [Candidatus Limnocylindrales bacterium]|nr:50S ribosomal protein L15 [Candidatus Limnocylindrales bacterium]